MFTHDEIWKAIDQLAEAHGYSASALAKKAGLDPTTFNKSKRLSPEGKPRWPSTESLSKILKVTNCGFADFMAPEDKEGIKPDYVICLKDGSLIEGEIEKRKETSLRIAGQNHNLGDIQWIAEKRDLKEF